MEEYDLTADQMNELNQLGQAGGEAAAMGMAIAGIFVFVLMIFLFIIPMSKIYKKAGQPGFAAWIPIYSQIVRAKVAEKPDWWGVLMIIPYVGAIFNIWGFNRVAKRFGKSEGFTVGIVFLPFIFIPMLGYGSAQYKAEAASGSEDVLDA